MILMVMSIYSDDDNLPFIRLYESCINNCDVDFALQVMYGMMLLSMSVIGTNRGCRLVAAVAPPALLNDSVFCFFGYFVKSMALPTTVSLAFAYLSSPGGMLCYC